MSDFCSESLQATVERMRHAAQAAKAGKLPTVIVSSRYDCSKRHIEEVRPICFLLRFFCPPFSLPAHALAPALSLSRSLSPRLSLPLSMGASAFTTDIHVNMR